ncbi:MAG: queuosine precursor transporter [Treponema sp.]|nr:queuosine precursor transporter [Treponema sp.]
MGIAAQGSQYRFLDIIAAFLVAVLITSNVASSAKIVDLGITVFGFWGIPPVRLAFDGGTLLFPVAYVLGDVLTEVYGFKVTRRVIWTGFGALALASLFFFVLSALPGEAVWEEHAGTAAYNAILGGMSSGGIALASLSAFLAGKFSNSIILSRLKVLMKGRALWVRVIGSSFVGHFLDSLVFVFVASLTGVFRWEIFASLVLTNYLFKASIGALLFPPTLVAIRKLKKAEGIDTYDIGVRLNPFSWK